MAFELASLAYFQLSLRFIRDAVVCPKTVKSCLSHVLQLLFQDWGKHKKSFYLGTKAIGISLLLWLAKLLSQGHLPTSSAALPSFQHWHSRPPLRWAYFLSSPRVPCSLSACLACRLSPPSLLLVLSSLGTRRVE